MLLVKRLLSLGQKLGRERGKGGRSKQREEKCRGGKSVDERLCELERAEVMMMPRRQYMDTSTKNAISKSGGGKCTMTPGERLLIDIEYSNNIQSGGHFELL